MLRPRHRPLALLALASLGTGVGAGLGVGARDGAAAAEARAPRPAKARRRAVTARTARARAIKVGAGRGWIPPEVLAATRAPLPGTPGPTAAGGAAGAGTPAGGTLAATATTPATAPPTTTAPPPAVPAVGVTLDDRGAYSARLSRATVASGPVVVQFINQGEDDHNLRVVPTDHAGDAEDFPLTGAGQTSTRTLTLTPGRYYVFCTLTTPVDHAAAGMSATLNVS